MQTNDDWDDVEALDYCNEDNKDHLKMQLERISATGAGAWEIAILDAISYDYGQVNDKAALARTAFGKNQLRHPTKAVAAVDKCFAERWIQFLTAEFLEQKQEELLTGGYLMPRGLIGHYRTEESPVGLISFTERGAALYHQWIEFDPNSEDGHWCLTGDTEGFDISYGSTLSACEYPVDNCSYPVIEREPAIAIGRWCDCWWNRFEHGYRIRFRYISPWPNG